VFSKPNIADPKRRKTVRTTTNDGPARMLNKVPEVTLFFWIIKIMATTVGETAADFLNVNLNLGLTGTAITMGVLLLAFLVAQMDSRKYVPWIYWMTVTLLSIFGTLMTDNLVDGFGVPLQTTTAVFAVALTVTFTAWYGIERSLSIHTITTTRRETFYWAAILFTFALGTAAGDLAAEGMHLGYATAALIYGGLIAAVACAYYVLKINAIAAFWIAYVLTRPFGASCGDLLSQPVNSGGLGLGTAGTSTIFLVTILGLVTYLTVCQKAVSNPPR